MDGITAEQIRNAKLWETTERKNPALVQVLKQACSRNKAIEKKQLWEQKDREDRGSASSISLKSRDGLVRNIAKVPRGAEVTDNNVNKYEQERARNADGKEDTQLDRFCNGNDTAWRPDTFFTEVCGDDDVPPWPIRPTELFTNPHIVMKIMAQQMEEKKRKRREKKQRKEEERQLKDARKEAKRSGKTGAKSGKKAKKDKRKDKKAKKDKRKDKKGKKEKKAKKTSRRADDVEPRRRTAQDTTEAGDSSSGASRDSDDAPDADAVAEPHGAPGRSGSSGSSGKREEVVLSSSSSTSDEAPDWE